MTLDGLSALSPPHAPGEGLLFARCAERAVRKTGPASAPMRRKALWSFLSRGYSSVGRAFEWHSKGQEFDSPYLHHKKG